jgi:hypothetical protein
MRHDQGRVAQGRRRIRAARRHRRRRVSSIAFRMRNASEPVTRLPPRRTLLRLRLAAGHLLISAGISAVVGVLVFSVWYPEPYRSLVGGLSLFGLMVTVDVVLGPVLTLVVANPRKSRAELARDILLIGLVQLSGLGYGIHSIALARPVHMVFEIDRMRVVTAADIDEDLLRQAPSGLKTLPWTGPTLIAAVKPDDPVDQMRAIELGLAGFDLSMVPTNWRPYASQAQDAWKRARPANDLLARHPEWARDVEAIARRRGLPIGQLRFLPLQAGRSNWVTLLGPPDARPIGYLPIDGFF